jgi:uncharacterized protein YjcR
MKRTKKLIHEPKLTWDQVNTMRTNYRWHSSTYGCRALAEKYGVSTNTVHKIIRGETWKVRPGSLDVPPPKLKRISRKAIPQYETSLERRLAELEAISKYFKITP